MQLAKLDRRLLVCGLVSLSPVELLQNMVSIRRIGLRGDMLAQQADGFINLTLLHRFIRLHDRRIGRPSAYFFVNDRASFFLQACIPDNDRAQHSKQEPAHVRPVGHAGHLPEQRAVEHFRKRPQRQ